MSEMAARVTLRTVNAALKAAGFAEELVRGRGYFYFTGGDAHTGPTSAVPVFHLSAYSVEAWVALRGELASAR
jgi:hypothetical protein